MSRIVLLLFSLIAPSMNADVNVQLNETDDDDLLNFASGMGSGMGPRDELISTTKIYGTTTTTMSSTTVDNKTKDDDDGNFHIIAVCAAVGGVLAIFFVIMLVLCCRRRYKMKAKQASMLQCQNGYMVSVYEAKSNKCEVRAAGVTRGVNNVPAISSAPATPKSDTRSKNEVISMDTLTTTSSIPTSTHGRYEDLKPGAPEVHTYSVMEHTYEEIPATKH